MAETVDLLIVVDNSRSMADKQAILARELPQWLSALDQAGARDLRAGVVTSSLGGLGSDACLGQSDASENDRGRLITRETTGATPGVIPTYEGLGFLLWDPELAHTPPGEPQLPVTADMLALLVEGAGEMGCGYESPLEAMYRFLIDPDPYESVDTQSGTLVPVGTDGVVLAQRASFLRPDSLLLVVVLSDEDDCSTRAEGNAFLSRQIYSPGSMQYFRLPKPRPECSADPHDACCRSCADPAPECPDASAHCDADGDGIPDALTMVEDAVNLRCFDQKRRFGVDFLYPIDRYIDGLTLRQVADRHGNVVDNPIYAPAPGGSVFAARHPDLVLLTAIVGVPWQDIARRDPSGAPNLLDGYQSPAELVDNGTWDLVLGDPSCYHTNPACQPQDPFMIASIDPRSGTHPLLGEPVAGPSSPHQSSVNGNDMSVPARDDLQFACIFPLSTPRDCEVAGPNDACECRGTVENIAANPTCWSGSAFTNLQTHAGAKPGIRHLQVVRGLGNRGFLGSVCPYQQVDPNLPTFGYLPTLTPLMETVQLRLRP